MVNKVNDKLLNDLFLYINEKLQDTQANNLIDYAKQYYKNVIFEDFDNIVAEDLFGAVLSHWNLALDLSDLHKVKVYNPTLEEHGWQSKHTVIEVVVKDMPFLLQSLCMEINRLGFTNHLVLHPVLCVQRDKNCKFITLSEEHIHADNNYIISHESMIHLEIDRQSDLSVMELLHNNLSKIIVDVRAATEDWQLCLNQMQSVIDELTLCKNNADMSDEIEFLKWLYDDHFVFLAYREYEVVKNQKGVGFKVIEGKSLGVLREEIIPIPNDTLKQISEETFKELNTASPLLITKATSKSTVHRPIFMDYIGIKQYNQAGEMIGEKRFLGLYASVAYSSHLKDIPLVATKISQIQKHFAFRPNSHSTRALLFILQSLPREEFFQADVKSLLSFTQGLMQLQHRQRVRVFVRQDIYGHFWSLLIFVPRDRFNTDTRKKIQLILQDVFKADSIEFTVQLSESILARLHYIIHADSCCRVDYDTRDIEHQIIDSLADWRDGLKSELNSYHGETKGTPLFNQYCDGFSAAYREDISCRTALLDIDKVEYLISTDAVAESLLYSPLTTDENKTLRFKLFSKGQASLSKSLPMLENMGVKVCDERPYSIIKKDCDDEFWMHDFGLELDSDTQVLDLNSIKPNFEETFEKCWFGEIENDGFNQLVLKAGISWQQVNIFRAYYLYLRQIGITFSQIYVEKTLSNNPEVVRLLTQYFNQRFDPTLQSEKNNFDQLYDTIEQAIEHVQSLDEDRILRRYLNLIQAAVRTNYFKNSLDEQGIPYFSTKFDSSKIINMPLPVPYFEIFVYSPRVEGIHLRGGPVARGGLRWSDRQEDYRTEILGLMKAQMTKNAVIVPTGAKGGFIVKGLNSAFDQKQKMAEVVNCYQILIKGLLDVTDNRIANQVIKPQQCVSYDEDDSYLVVAADKGTATFSDYANALSLEYGFWLGDAFASGGSVGYDHKLMGITARGAWESVKQHFNRLNIHYLNKPFTTIGIGSMVGDVFGNGMLLSRQIKLVGSFDHQYIFLDPDPDPEKSFIERQRLFALPKSQWSDYDQSIISHGGGIYARSLKSISLSPQVKQRLNITIDQVTPQELIKLLLCAPVDLLWNGGIGTYVKSSAENNHEVGDRANDAVRVNGSELRCKLVGEGGNLGFTQPGRIEYAEHGGQINTDSIDNSAGVDCSDHEVNIKILINDLVMQGELTEKQRNLLLESMTEEVGELVLKHNYHQNRAITMIVRNSVHELMEVQWLINTLEKKGNLNRVLETIPDNEELQERQLNNIGLVRPEASVLLAYSKQLLKQLLVVELKNLDKDLFLQQLRQYFPKQLQDRFSDDISQHYLAQEIVVNSLVNSIVNRMGMALVFKIMEETGCTIVSVFNVYQQVCQIFEIDKLWQDIETQDIHLSAEVLDEIERKIRQLIERSMHWFINQNQSINDKKIFAEGITELKNSISSFMSEQKSHDNDEKMALLIADNIPSNLAHSIVILDDMYLCLDVVWLFNQSNSSLEECAQVYFKLMLILDLQWIQEKISILPSKTVWESLAKQTAKKEFNAVSCALSISVLKNKDTLLTDKIDSWLVSVDKPIARYRKLLASVHADDSVELEKITVLLKELRDLSVVN